jgi:hypothetical protein
MRIVVFFASLRRKSHTAFKRPYRRARKIFPPPAVSRRGNKIAASPVLTAMVANGNGSPPTATT